MTFRHVDGIGVTRGMRCREVGAGSPAGLAERAGTAGRAVCTDIDVS